MPEYENDCPEFKEHSDGDDGTVECSKCRGDEDEMPKCTKCGGKGRVAWR